MANAVDSGSARRPALNWPRRRVRVARPRAGAARRALKNSGSALRMRVSWQAPRLLLIGNSQTRSRACSTFATGTRSK